MILLGEGDIRSEVLWIPLHKLGSPACSPCIDRSIQRSGPLGYRFGCLVIDNVCLFSCKKITRGSISTVIDDPVGIYRLMAGRGILVRGKTKIYHFVDDVTVSQQILPFTSARAN